MPKTTAGQLLRLLRTHQIVVAICVTTAITMMGQGVIAPVLPLFAKEYGVGLVMVGVTVAAYGMGRLVANLPAGFIAERFGRRVVLISGLLILAIGSVMMAVTDSFIELVVFRFISGIGSAVYVTGAMITLIDISTPANRARYMSFQQGSILLGTGLGPVIGGFAAELWGFRSAFYLLAALSTAGLVWAFFQMPETAGLRKDQGAPHRTLTGASPSSASQGGAGFLSMLRNPNFILVGFYFFMVVFTRHGGRGSIVPLLGDAQVGLGPGQIGVAFTVMVLMNFVLVVPAGVFSDRFGRKVLMLPGALITATGLILFVSSTSFATFILASLVLGIGTGLAGPSPAAFVADLAPPDKRGMAIGLFRTYGDLGGIVGPVLLGWVVDVATFGWALNINVFLVIISAVALALLAKEPARPSRSGAYRS